jgi:hypothetical protein
MIALHSTSLVPARRQAFAPVPVARLVALEGAYAANSRCVLSRHALTLLTPAQLAAVADVEVRTAACGCACARVLLSAVLDILPRAQQGRLHIHERAASIGALLRHLPRLQRYQILLLVHCVDVAVPLQRND